MGAWKELLRRHVVQAVMTYLIGAWVVLQVADVLGPSMGLPAKALTYVAALAAIGLVPTAIVAWIYDLRRGRLVRSLPAAPAEPWSPDRPRRLAVLPFHLLRADPELHHLGFSLADAIAGDLSAARSLVVDSSALIPGHEPEDPESVGTRLHADVVLTGTILHESGRIEVRPQLTSVHDRRILWSQRIALPMADLFQVQNKVVAEVVGALTGREPAKQRPALSRTQPDIPASPAAYELYLRANHRSVQSGRWEEARSLYLDCLREDPNFAPAWARLGRCERLIAKWSAGDAGHRESTAGAEAAFQRALALNPDLPFAHSQYAQLELDLGRSEEAMVRIVARIQAAGPHADLFAGLVQACRFCGLLDESVAAAAHARALDPRIRTSVAHTHLMRGEYEQALAEYNNADIGYMEGLALAMLGRTAEAVSVLSMYEQQRAGTPVGDYVGSLRALLAGERAESIAATESSIASGMGRDGESVYYMTRQLAYLGEERRALDLFSRVIDLGYICHPAFERDPWLQPLRAHPEFLALLRVTELRHRQARGAWLEAGGDRIVELPVS